jgi:hypothetical protein
MKRLIFILFSIGLTVNSNAQTGVKNNTSCDFLRNLKFIHGLDTITAKATFNDLFRRPDYPILKKLDGEKNPLQRVWG